MSATFNLMHPDQSEPKRVQISNRFIYMLHICLFRLKIKYQFISMQLFSR